MVLLTLLSTLVAFVSPAEASVPSRDSREFRVVIDPGHGGTDLGTVYDDGQKRIAEKDVTLALAREAAEALRDRGVRAILTRNNDRDVPLPSRTALANRLEANVFISIHMNSTATPMTTDAQGVETFILNNTSDASSRRLAHLENSVLGRAVEDSPQDMDVAMILKDLRLDGNLSESKRLACGLQARLISTSESPGVQPVSRRAAMLRNRGVRQALFYVLLGADMPSALVEAGFLTNPRDRHLVMTPSGRHSIAKAIADAIDAYRAGNATSESSTALARCKVN